MPEQDKTDRIAAFLTDRQWLTDIGSVAFLAAGEYNENYIVRSSSGKYVFRLNHGSQLDLENQIEYEYGVLKAVEPSGVTPRVFHCEPDPRDLEGGVLLMEYIDGGPFDYHQDRDKAAAVFARIHSLEPDTRKLIQQRDPIRDIAEESLRLLSRFSDHPMTEARQRLQDYHREIVELADHMEGLFSGEPLCMVNTEVNSGNFIVRDSRAFLVDWEKAVVSYRYQDLGHFLVTTTTLWKSDIRYTEKQKVSFLKAYLADIDDGLSLDEVREKTHILERTILLRALSWCFMAYYEYTRSDRSLRNRDTFEKIKSYLENIPELLER